MTSVLNVDTIADKAGTGPVELTKQSAAKAWVHYNGTGTAAILNSANVSSLTDNGSGNIAANFGNSMSDADYCATALLGYVGIDFLVASQNLARTSSTFTALSKNLSAVNTDGDEQSYLIHGDLA